MNKGTAIVGFLLSFIAGMGLMWAIAQKDGVSISAEKGGMMAAGDADAHAASPIPIGSDDPQWGSPDALVTIVEVSDFQCPFCSRVNPTIKSIKDKYGADKVRLVWKHNPLPFHKEARPAHEASQTVFALGGSDAFWKFHDLAFANQKELTEAKFSEWAEQSGVPRAEFEAAFKAKKHAAKVDKDLALNRKIGATGTPAFRINGVTLSGAQPLAKFTEVIDQQLKEAEALLKKGTDKSKVSLELTQTNFKAPAEKPAQAGQEAEDTTIWKVPVLKDDPVKGPADALVTITEWSDFECPFCTRVGPALDKVMETYKDDVRIVWKDNPLPFHKRAKAAAGLARAAYEKGGDKLFWQAHDELFANQKNLEDAGLEQIATKLGLPWASLKDKLETDKYQKKISETLAMGTDINVRGTPHFFINGRRLSGAQPFEKFKELIDGELAKAKALVQKGMPRDKVYENIMKLAKGAEEAEKRDVPAPTKDNPSYGPDNAKVVIQEFSDFQCPFCGRVGPTLEQVKKEFAGKVKIVWRNYPLPFHAEAPLAAEAALEAFAQKGKDGFWAYHDKLFANQKELKQPDLEKYAGEVGLDVAKFKAALESHKHKAVVDADIEAAKKAGVTGTPAFTINGYFLSGAQPYPKFEKLIQLALKDSK